MGFFRDRASIKTLPLATNTLYYKRVQVLGSVEGLEVGLQRNQLYLYTRYKHPSVYKYYTSRDDVMKHGNHQPAKYKIRRTAHALTFREEMLIQVMSNNI